MLHDHLIARTEPAADPANLVYFGNKRITVLTERLFRIEESSGNGSFCDEATQAVWFRNPGPVGFSARKEGGCLVIETDAVTLIVREKLMESRVTLKNPDGAGMAGVQLSEAAGLPGTCRTLDNFNGDMKIPYDWDLTKACRIELDQGITSRSGAALYDDSSSLILGKDGKVRPRENPETDLYVFAYGHDYRAAVRALFSICGPTPLIPRFALGTWWSRYHAYTQKEYLDLMDSFADRGIPFTVATVDMDWHPSKDIPDGKGGWYGGWTGYSWNEELFPDYRGFLKELHKRNLHVTLNLHPAQGVRYFDVQYREMAERMGIDPETKETVEFDITDERFINAYFDVLHKPYEHEGVDFWWIDWQQGRESAIPGLDPLWSLNHYHWLDSRKEKEGLILSRYAGIGSHRYPLGFSGDTLMTWDTLRFLPYFTSSATNVGYTWWSHDIGAHMLGYKDDELYARFIQFGVFSPIMRIHSSNNPMLVKDPCSYPGGVGLIAKEFLLLRQAMLPFLYSASVKTAEQGLALIEPVYYGWPEEEEAYQCPGQYLFGQQMIAAPVTEHSGPDGMVTKDVWLPEGTWTDLFTGDVYEGGGWRKMTRGLEAFPLLLKEGGFFVLDNAPEGGGTGLPEVLKVMTAQGNGGYVLAEDRDGKRIFTKFVSVHEEDGSRKITIEAGRDLSVVLECMDVYDADAAVSVDGEEAPFRLRSYLGHTKLTTDTLPEGSTAVIRIREKVGEREKRNAVIMRLMQQIQADNGLKERLYKELTEAVSRIQYEAIVCISGLSETDRERLLEIRWK